MYQQVTLIGNVGKDPEVVTFNNGNSITKFSMATSRSWKDDQGERQTKTTWHNIVVKGSQQGYVQNYVKAGSKLHITGEIEVDIKKDEMGKTTATFHSISAQRVLGLDSRDSANSGDAPVQQAAPVYAPQQVPMQAAPQQAAPMQYAPAPQQAAPVQYAQAPQQAAPQQYAQAPQQYAPAPQAPMPSGHVAAQPEDSIPF